MDKLFLSYELSLKAKELGYNDECFAYYNQECFIHAWEWNYRLFKNSEILKDDVAAPLYQQVIDWLRQEHKITIEGKTLEDGYTFHVFRNQEELVKSITKLFDDDKRADFVYKDYYQAFDSAISQAFKLIEAKQNIKS